MNILFFDVESTGLPVDWKKPMSDLDNWPRVLQLAWLWTDETGKEKSRYSFLIQPDGWFVPTGNFWIENGFSQEDNMINGRPILEVLSMFRMYINRSDYLVSHNLSFDYNVVGAEMIRAGIRCDNVPIKICTKELGVDICKIPFGTDRRPWKEHNYKWPKLSELHTHLFGKDFEGSHDALNDCIAVKDCFFRMIELGVINVKMENV